MHFGLGTKILLLGDFSVSLIDKADGFQPKEREKLLDENVEGPSPC